MAVQMELKDGRTITRPMPPEMVGTQESTDPAAVEKAAKAEEKRRAEEAKLAEKAAKAEEKRRAEEAKLAEKAAKAE